MKSNSRKRTSFPPFKNRRTRRAYIGVPNAQHQRGREITTTLFPRQPPPGSQRAGMRPQLEAFARMYEHHAAIEIRSSFQPGKDDDERSTDVISDRLKNQHAQFGKDGYEDAVKADGDIEPVWASRPGQFTAPPHQLLPQCQA